MSESNFDIAALMAKPVWQKINFGILFGIFLYENAFYNTVEGILAEGTRFELVVQNNPYGSLANCWFQPLTHPSGLKAFETPSLTDGNAKIRTFFQFARYWPKKCSRGSHPDCIFWLNRNNDNLITNFSLVNCKVKRIGN